MEKRWELTERKATYILRYYLPRPPYVSESTTLQRLDELISFCRRSKVEAVQFYVNLRDDWYYMPDLPGHAIKWASEMEEFIPAIRKAGISYQLNIQNILGATTGQTDMKADYSWEYLVDHRGIENTGCACPIGTQFRELMGSQLRAWAATKPDVMWIDDDLRLHNHGFGWKGLDWYCYCPKHIELFSEKLGYKMTREELIGCMLKPGIPGKERIAWLDFLNGTMADTAAWIERQIHTVSPQTRIAQMISLPDIHSVEGRNWGEFLGNLSGNGFKPITRPHFGPYTETNPVGFISSYTVLDHTITNMKMQYRGEIDACPELENTRFTRWAKSGAATRYQLVLGQLLGCKGITLSLFDLEGTPLDEEPLYEKILTNEKATLDRLAELQLDKWLPRGVGLLADPEAARKVQFMKENDNSLISLMGPGRTWDNNLLMLGVPAHYISCKDTAGAEVIALDGLTAWLPDDKCMEEILSKGVLLDSKAAEVLERRGFGSLIGVSGGDVQKNQTSAEIFHGAILDGMTEKRMPLRIAKDNWSELIPCESSQVLSEIIDPKGERHHGTVIYENKLGGRVATYSGCIDLGVEFCNHTRVLWVTALLNWMGKGKFPLNIKAEQRLLTLRRDSEKGILLAFANLAADAVEEVKGSIITQDKIITVKKLCSDGEWRALEDAAFIETSKDRYEFAVPAGLQLYDWLILLVE